MAAAAHPPVEYYTFFLKSLLETVRINIGECAAASYSTLTIAAATKLFMFDNEKVRTFCLDDITNSALFFKVIIDIKNPTIISDVFIFHFCSIF